MDALRAAEKLTVFEATLISRGKARARGHSQKGRQLVSNYRVKKPNPMIPPRTNSGCCWDKQPLQNDVIKERSSGQKLVFVAMSEEFIEHINQAVLHSTTVTAQS